MPAGGQPRGGSGRQRELGTFWPSEGTAHKVQREGEGENEEMELT